MFQNSLLSPYITIIGRQFLHGHIKNAIMGSGFIKRQFWVHFWVHDVKTIILSIYAMGLQHQEPSIFLTTKKKK
jgi:hypothetical protein